MTGLAGTRLMARVATSYGQPLPRGQLSNLPPLFYFIFSALFPSCVRAPDRSVSLDSKVVADRQQEQKDQHCRNKELYDTRKRNPVGNDRREAC